MSESSTATIETAATVDATPEPPKAVVDVPKSDNGIKIEELPQHAVKLLDAATKLPEQRDQLDQRAFNVIVRHLTNVNVDDDAVVRKMVELPAYSKGGQGSFRYTKERAALLMGIAESNGVAATLTHTGYSYPKPESKRRQYQVHLFGTRVDIDRVVAIFQAFQGRALVDAYKIEFTPQQQNVPTEQTKIRRRWMIAFAEATRTALAQVVEAKVKGKAEATLSDRSTRAHAALEEWDKENKSEGTEVVEASTTAQS